ncbi:MAG: hypothetical protein ABJN75_19720 [Hoeflea sp.]|uniref:hypothetical protein n=1 Tax=Hoeflea sp. TaxID=1940281 RepID=UPI0032972EFF
MSLFSRRYIQKMLNELAVHLNSEKRVDLIRRLDSKRMNQNMPAEMELAVLWSVAQTGDLVIEPEWWSGNRNPDGYSESLVEGKSVIFDITAVSNGSVSQRDDMKKAADRVCQFASSVKKKFGKHLSFYFFEEGALTKRYDKRRVLVKAGYELSKTQEARIRDWIDGRSYETEPIQVHEQGVVFQVSYSKTPHMTPPVNTSMPPECYSLTKNPIYVAMDNKRKQLRGGDTGVLRLIFLADVGADLLHQIGGYIHRSWSPEQTYGPEIIQNFIRRFSGEIDAVVVISAWDTRFRGSRFFGVRSDPNLWKVTVFAADNSKIDWSNIENMFTRLPPPITDANLARQNQGYGGFEPISKIRYRAAQTYQRKEPYLMQLKLSSGALRDLISGDLDPAEFRDRHIPERFRTLIKRHRSISSVEFEKGEPNHDDDLVVLSFEEDPAVKPFE